MALAVFFLLLGMAATEATLIGLNSAALVGAALWALSALTLVSLYRRSVAAKRVTQIDKIDSPRTDSGVARAA